MSNSLKQNKNILYILPEDEKLHRVATGFKTSLCISQQNIQIWKFQRGWKKVFDEITQDHLPKLSQSCYAQARILAIIDCDSDLARGKQLMDNIPHELQDRVFVLCINGEIEDLKRENRYMPLENIGTTLANECVRSSNNPDDIWQHERLRHNANEVKRLKDRVESFLFKP